ncbi:hypothetical protein [Photobacterium ganghwense]|uniref:hypothetical protein n=1 Tax=Photobacterium ganghwense TaxID=320778 RepID=UPI001A8CA823|nr:hypothetical protein [Photobacterium ganghwense]QSV13778.1 hypothetical protein FH974_13780 [Photobacterium ganghwense]
MGGSGGGYTPSGTDNKCRNINFQATLNSPQAVVSSLQVGEILDVVLLHGTVTALYNGQPVGSLTGPQIQRIINCINNGYKYIAEVIYVAGGKCTVKVSCDD